MAERSRSLELKVGIFVFIGLVVLVWFVLLIGDFNLIKHGYLIKVKFGFANGIKIGAPMRLAGVDKGEVKEILLGHEGDTGNAQVILTAWVDSDTQIPRDSRAWVNTLGLLGEKYLEVIPGKDYQHILAPDEMLVGEDPASVQEVTDLIKDIALQSKDALADLSAVLKDIHEGRGTVGKLFTDDRLYTDIEEMFADLKKHPWKLLFRPKGAD
jgi:phospholipid/cholesterol/gamma-HCH transport system substrate-binding protein